MATQTSEKLVKETAKYIWGRLKVIFLMIILMIIVKNHPGWDRFFLFVLLLQVVLAVLVVLRLPKKLEKIQQEERKREYQRTYYNYAYDRFRNSYRQRATIFNNTSDISKSATILGVNIVQDDEETIKKKYRKLAMKWHPDRFSNDTLENQDIAKRNFQKLNNAYEVIKKHKNIN